MAEIVLLPTELREGRGTRISEKLRKQGKVPAVVYGHKEKTLSLSVGHDVLLNAIRHGARIVDVQLDGKVEKAQIMELQWDYLGKDVLHVDFKRGADEKIQITVPVELKGIAPGIAGGGIIDQPLHTLRIECPVLAVPDSIRVNINELQIDSAIHVRELKLPEGVKVLDEGDAIVVQVKTPLAEAEDGEGGEGTAEPEIITARKKAERRGRGEEVTSRKDQPQSHREHREYKEEEPTQAFLESCLVPPFLLFCCLVFSVISVTLWLVSVLG